MSNQMRQRVTELVTIQNEIAKGDLLDPNKTKTELIAALARFVLPPAEGGLGFHLLLTAINSDHHDDSARGPHSHRAGYCADIGSVADVLDPLNMEDVGSGAITGDFVKACMEANGWVSSVGLGGPATIFLNLSALWDKPLWKDNDEPHVHLTCAGDGGEQV